VQRVERQLTYCERERCFSQREGTHCDDLALPVHGRLEAHGVRLEVVKVAAEDVDAGGLVDLVVALAREEAGRAQAVAGRVLGEEVVDLGLRGGTGELRRGR